MSDDVYLDADGPVASIVLNRPEKRNAVTFEMWRRLAALCAEFERNPDYKVLVLRGAGGQAFSGGADISEFETLRATAEDSQAYNEASRRAQDDLAALSKPTVALVQGVCVGGGCGLALSCDIRLCGTTARFAITPAKLGIVYPLNVTKRLVDLVGPAHAKAILYTGMQIDARRAYEIGLVNDVVADDRVVEETMELAKTVASRAPYSIRATKRMVELVCGGLAEESDETRAIRSGAFDTADYREGVRAFLEKRPAMFRDA